MRAIDTVLLLFLVTLFMDDEWMCSWALQPQSFQRQPNRRDWFFQTVTTAASTLLLQPQAAGAGLQQFPCERPLKNRYHFMRAGLSELEDENIYSTNALFLTNRENAMTLKARASVVAAVQKMKEVGQTPTVAYHSLAANGMDAGDLIATELRLGRDRLLPEFTYLDQRGIGLWDSMSYTTTKAAIVALDYAEAGKYGTGGRPPPNEDGTPNETLADQVVRLTQFLSLQESRTSGENILVIFPDGTGPALLSSLIAGIPLNECHALDYVPGEIRLDVTRESILKQFAEKKEDPDYLAMLEEGKAELATLRKETSSGVAFVSKKDKMADERRLQLDEEFLKEKERQRELERQKQEEARLVREEERIAQAELLRAKEQQREIERQQRLAKQEDRASLAEKERLRRREEKIHREMGRSQGKSESATTSSTLAEYSSSGRMFPLIGGMSVLTLTAATLALAENDDEERAGTSPVLDPVDQSLKKRTEIVSKVTSSTVAESFADLNVTSTGKVSLNEGGESLTSAKSISSTPKKEMPTSSSNTTTIPSSLTNSSSYQNITMARKDENIAPTEVTLSSTVNPIESTSVASSRNQIDLGDFDDGEAWLRLLMEIRDEDDFLLQPGTSTEKVKKP